MRVSSFMIPANKVVWVTPKDTVRRVMDLMVENKIGAVAVMPEEQAREQVDALSPESPNTAMPIGIITKSDILFAYHNMVGIDDPCEAIMPRDKPLQTCSPNVDRDQAARILEQNHTHHIIVVNKDASDDSPHFVGLISSWDLSAECARDDRAWPWIRSEDGRFHNPFPRVKKSSALKYDKQSILHHDHEEYTVYMDELDVLNFQ